MSKKYRVNSWDEEYNVYLTVAKWCNKAKIGESVGGSGFLIQIVEKECA